MGRDAVPATPGDADGHDVPDGSLAPGRDLSTIPRPLVAALNDGMIVPFVGAGVSMADPTRLPSAEQLASQLVARGHAMADDDLEEVAEKMFADGGPLAFARALPSEDWRARQPNDCHVVLAELAAEGLVQVVLTTNWDTMLETALNRIGVPFARIAKPVDLAVWDGRAVRVVKLHGCIEVPETIKARRTEVDAEDWLDQWVDATLPEIVRTKSFLFVGYSGASRATTKSFEKVSTEAARVQSDWMVGRSPFESVATRERSDHLVAATGTPGERYVQTDSVAFFRELRNAIQPLIHHRGAQQALALLATLLQPTTASADEFATSIRATEAGWAALDHDRRQALLRGLIPSSRDKGYVPFIAHAQELGRYWAWLAFADVAGAIQLNETRTVATVTTDQSIQVLPVLCGSFERRDEAAMSVMADLVGAPDSPTATYLGVVLGGMGPLQPPDAPFNIARGVGAGDVVRGGEVRIGWVDIADLFDVVDRDVDDAGLRSAVATRMTEFVSGLRTQ